DGKSSSVSEVNRKLLEEVNNNPATKNILERIKIEKGIHENFSENKVVGLFLALLSLWLILPLFWKTPSRLVLLRPFNENEATKRIIKVINKNFKFCGHIFTLEDSDVSESNLRFWYRYLRVFLFIALILYPITKHISPRLTVRTYAGFEALKDRL